MRLLQERGETPASFLIREATLEDVPALAALHVQTFIETYGGRNPPSIKTRMHQWEVLFGIPQNPSSYFHEALGGKKLYNSKGGFDGGYGWKDISDLTK